MHRKDSGSTPLQPRSIEPKWKVVKCAFHANDDCRDDRAGSNDLTNVILRR